MTNEITQTNCIICGDCRDQLDLPRTCVELREMNSLEFRNLVITRLDVKPNRNYDIHVDGWTYKMDEFGMRQKMGLAAVIQIKQSDKVGISGIRNLVGTMAIDRYTDGKTGIFVAFSFTLGAREFVRKLKVESGISVQLLTVKELFDCE